MFIAKGLSSWGAVFYSGAGRSRGWWVGLVGPDGAVSTAVADLIPAASAEDARALARLLASLHPTYAAAFAAVTLRPVLESVELTPLSWPEIALVLRSVALYAPRGARP